MNEIPDCITGIEPVPGNSSLVRVLFESHDPVTLHLRSFSELDLKVGLRIREDLFAQIERAVDTDHAYNLAIRYLSPKPRTSVEIATYLTRKGISADATAEAVRRLKVRGLIDDETYARAYRLQKQRTHSRREIREQLRRRGVTWTEPEEGDGGVQSEREAAQLAAAKYLRTHRQGDVRTRLMKMAAHLGRRGFAGGIIRSVMADMKRDLAASENDDPS